MPPILQGIITIVVGVGGCVGYFYFANLFLDKVVFPPRPVAGATSRMRRVIGRVVLGALAAFLFAVSGLGQLLFETAGIGFFIAIDSLWVTLGDIASLPFRLVVGLFAPETLGASAAIAVMAILYIVVCLSVLILLAGWAMHGKGPQGVGDAINGANQLRPWLFLLPAIFALGLYLVYPVFGSFGRSMYDRDNLVFVGADNYVRLFNNPDFRQAFLNNILWALVVPAVTTFMGLLIAQLTDRLSWGNIAKSIIFMPMAISFVGASLIWKFVYAQDPDLGIINAIATSFGAAPVDPLQIPFWNNFLLMVILIWIQTGFSMVILSAALRGVPEETIEAAIIDGANPFQVFFKIKVPQIIGTIVVVWTTITILVLKVFDIVYTMTGGNYGTEILPSFMMDFMFRDDGLATAVAFVIMLVVLPVMIWNIAQARKEMR